MKKNFTRTRVESRVMLPVTMVENHANSLYHPKKDPRRLMNAEEKAFSDNYENIDWCFEELPVEGKVEISFSTNRSNISTYISVPVTACFCIVCTKGKEKDYKVTWNCSLS